MYPSQSHFKLAETPTALSLRLIIWIVGCVIAVAAPAAHADTYSLFTLSGYASYSQTTGSLMFDQTTGKVTSFAFGAVTQITGQTGNQIETPEETFSFDDPFQGNTGGYFSGGGVFTSSGTATFAGTLQSFTLSGTSTCIGCGSAATTETGSLLLNLTTGEVTSFSFASNSKIVSQSGGAIDTPSAYFHFGQSFIGYKGREFQRRTCLKPRCSHFKLRGYSNR